MIKIIDSQNQIFIPSASNIKITAEINAEYRLSFNVLKTDGAWDFLCKGRLLKCDNQLYRVYSTTEENSGLITKSVECVHVITDATLTHLVKFPVLSMGYTYLEDISPHDLMVKAFNGTPFRVMDLNEADWVTTTTDFYPISKTNPLAVVQKLIEQLGGGELLLNGYDIALVKSLGRETGLVFDMRTNLKSISKQTDIDSVITVLYGYGKDSLMIEDEFVLSPNVNDYELPRESSMEFDWITNVSRLEAAMNYMFSPDNPNRIDVPKVSYKISFIDLTKAGYPNYKIGLGDTINLSDSVLGINEAQRIKKYEYYPFSPENSSVELGSPRRTMLDYIKKSTMGGSLNGI
ncbi:MAG: prophage endopeptidase tail family protein [Bacillota bacterium]